MNRTQVQQTRIRHASAYSTIELSALQLLKQKCTLVELARQLWPGRTLVGPAAAIVGRLSTQGLIWKQERCWGITEAGQEILDTIK